MIDFNSLEISIKNQCMLLNINRSGVYYKTKEETEKDLTIMLDIDKLYTKDPSMGTRRISFMLQQKGYIIGRAHVRTLMKKMRIRVIYCHPRTTVINPTKYKYPYLLSNLKIDRSNQVWAIDITYIPMNKGHMYMIAIIDLYSRYLINWSISNTMDAKWVVETVKEAVEKYGKPDIINSDQGSQFTSDEYINYIKSLQYTQISMDGKGRALDNIFIERFWRTIKYEKIYLNPPIDGVDLYKTCEDFIHYYNYERIHSSLNYKTPESIFKNVA
jgi:putative transposase